jgi:hypothetical protein
MKPRGELDPSPLAIPFTFPRIARVQALFTTRIGGAGQAGYAQGNLSYTVGDDPDQVRKNRRGLQLAWGYRELAEVNQVHGHSLVTADDGLSGLEALEADGLATQIEGRALCIKTADCQPLLLAHRLARQQGPVPSQRPETVLCRLRLAAQAGLCGQGAQPEPTAEPVRELCYGLGPRIRRLPNPSRTDHGPLASDPGPAAPGRSPL